MAGFGHLLTNAVDQLPPPGTWQPVPPVSDRAVWSAVDQDTRALLLAQAEDSAARPFEVPRASDWRRYLTDGDRAVWEQDQLTLRDRLAQAVVAACLTDEPRWVDEAIDGIWVLCEQTSWCIPAHDRFGQAGDSAGLPEPDRPFLDLFAAECGSLLAWADAAIGERIEAVTPVVRRRMADLVRERVLRPFREQEWWWLEFGNNWSTWIVSNVTVCALRFDRTRHELAGTLATVGRGLDAFLDAQPDDGACEEGPSYWWVAAGRVGRLLLDLRQATDGALDGFVDPKVRALLGYLPAMHLGDLWFVNVGDGAARPDRLDHAQLLDELGRVADLPALRALARELQPPGRPLLNGVAGHNGPLGFALAALTDPIWREREAVVAYWPRTVWLPDVQLLVARTAEGTADGLTLAVWGGHNGVPHNHNDVGSLVVAVDGVPLVVDAGVGTYTRQTFSDERYSIWTMQSSWHNLPEIDGVAQQPGAEHRAADVDLADTEASTGLTLELAAAWPAEAGLASLRRAAHLDRTRDEVRLTDRWRTTGDRGRPSDVRLHLLLRRDAEVVQPGTLRVAAPDGPALVIGFDPDRLEPVLEDRTVDARLAPVWGDGLTRLSLVVRDPTAEGEVAVTFRRAPQSP